MTTNQGDASFLRGTRSFSFLMLLLLAGISGALFSHVGAYLLTRHQHSSRLNELNAIISSHKARIELRDGLDTRDLISALGNLFGVPSSSTDTGALNGVLSSIESGITKLLGDAGGSILDGLATPAKFLGIGLASGALTSLNVTMSANITTATGVDSIAENLGSGLTSTIFSSDSVKSLFTPSNLTSEPGGTLGGSGGTVGQAVLALAQGLGGGASSGLKLTAPGTTTTMFNTSGVNGIAGNFGQGLSSSLLSTIQMPSAAYLLDSVMGLFSGSGPNSTINAAEIGTGLGTGLGEGAAIGLGFQNDTSTPPDTIAGIGQGFIKGLVSSFLQNGTVIKLADSLVSLTGNSPGLSLRNIDVAKAAEGLAVGLVSGAGSQISTLQLISADTASFNDSVGGAATGFGRGLGSEGARLVSQVLAGAKTSTGKRNLESTSDIAAYRAIRLRRRTTTTPANATDLASVLSNLNASNINPLIQTGIDALTCEGVGGIVAVFLGLIQSKTINLNSINTGSLTVSNSNLTLPDQVFIVKSSGNTYLVDPAEGLGTATINGMSIGRFIGVAAAHILFAILAYFVAIPLFLLSLNGLRVAQLLAQPASKGPAPNLPRWLVYLGWSIVPAASLTFGLGIGFGGGKKHFTTPHEILGLIIFLQTLAAAALTQYLRQYAYPTGGSSPSLLMKRLKIANMVNIAIMFLFMELTLIFGFADLSSMSLCVTQAVISTPVWVALGGILLGPLVLAIGLEVLMLWLLWVEKRQESARMQTITSIRVEKTSRVNYLDV